MKRLWVAFWIAVILMIFGWIDVWIGVGIVREIQAEIWWLVWILSFLGLIFLVVVWRLALILLTLIRGDVTPSLAWRDVRNVFANAIFMGKTGVIK